MPRRCDGLRGKKIFFKEKKIFFIQDQEKKWAMEFFFRDNLIKIFYKFFFLQKKIFFYKKIKKNKKNFINWGEKKILVRKKNYFFSIIIGVEQTFCGIDGDD